jgi:hypothetical protein
MGRTNLAKARARANALKKELHELIEYVIKDTDGNELLREQETLAIETKTSFLKKFKLPYSLAEGDYVFYVRVIYGGEVASASSWFKIEQKREVPWSRVILYLILFFILFVIIRLYQLYVKERREEKVKKYEEEEEREESRKKSPKEDYLVIKPKSDKKKIVKKKPVEKKKSGSMITPEGYLDLTKLFKK